MAFSPDGKTLAAGVSADVALRGVMLWDVAGFGGGILLWDEAALDAPGGYPGGASTVTDGMALGDSAEREHHRGVEGRGEGSALWCSASTLLYTSFRGMIPPGILR